MQLKKLSEYIEHIGELVIENKTHADPLVKSICNDSRKIESCSIFVAIRGASDDGHRFIQKAISDGAAAIIHENNIPPGDYKTQFIRVKDSRMAYSRLCEMFFDFPSKELKLLGITGTNGKTTSAFLAQATLESSGSKCGLISTVCANNGKEIFESTRTTPDAFELQRLFCEMSENSCSHVVMEVSSHSLDQNRVGTAKFAGAIFTNLSGDHLDYHKDMQTYFSAKKILFQEHCDQKSIVAINCDDEYGRILASKLGNREIFSFGKSSDAKYRIIPLSMSGSGSEFEIVKAGKKWKLTCPLPGEYNIFNAAGVFTLCHELGIPPEHIAATLANPPRIPGRMEKIKTDAGFTIVIDYAHTDDALERVLKTLKPACRGRLICVFGCGGDRDKTKRPRMGAVSAKFADFTIVTSDNPRTENPDDIIAEILAGIPQGCPHLDESDRRQAIRVAVSLAKSGDIILLAGKGHENYQDIAGVKLHFDDIEEALSACRAEGVSASLHAKTGKNRP